MSQHEASVIDQLRFDTSAAMDNRRYIAALSSVGLLDFTLMTLFQTGALRRLPDLPLSFVTSERVISSKAAAIYGLPDAVIALNLYAANLILIALASAKKKKTRVYDLLLGGVVAGNAAGSLYFMLNMIFVQKKVCVYCITGAAISFMSISPLLKLLRGKKKNEYSRAQ